MKFAHALFLVLAITLLCTSTIAAQERPTSYVLFKGGLYSPSNSYDLRNFNAGSTTNFDNKTGFYGGGAIGVYVLPVVAIELEGGYFESKGSPTVPPGETRLIVVPVVLTGKVLLPLGLFEPFAELGAGAYIAKLETDSNTGTLSDTSQTAFGFHAGGGVNVNFSQSFFVQLEGRYLWSNPSFGGQPVKLNGFLATGGLGLRF